MATTGTPQKVNRADLIDALKRNRRGIDEVEAKLDLGMLPTKIWKTSPCSPGARLIFAGN